MATSEKRTKEIAGYAKKHGVEKAAKKYGISKESVDRYIRKAKRKRWNVPRWVGGRAKRPAGSRPPPAPPQPQNLPSAASSTSCAT